MAWKPLWRTLTFHPLVSLGNKPRNRFPFLPLNKAYLNHRLYGFFFQFFRCFLISLRLFDSFAQFLFEKLDLKRKFSYKS